LQLALHFFSVALLCFPFSFLAVAVTLLLLLHYHYHYHYHYQPATACLFGSLSPEGMEA
jgi:hypothetical protein